MYLYPLTRTMGARTTPAILLASGLLAVVVAGMILLAPEALYAGHGIRLTGNPTLASELKASAGALLFAGLAMFAGAFRRRLVTFSLGTATAVYLSYGAARLLSIALDGVPHGALLAAAGLEILIGSVCGLTLLQARRERTLSLQTRSTT